MNTVFINGDIVAFNHGLSEAYDIATLNNELNAIDKTDLKELTIDINTFGGDVTAGFAMANIIRRFAAENSVEITTRISGYCSSIGTVIFLAGDKRIGNDYADFFVHNAFTLAIGDKNEMKKQYEDLDKISNQIAKYYSQKTTIPFDEAVKLMDNSTNIDSKTALKYGFFTEVENSVKAYNSTSIRNLLIQNNSKLNTNKNEKQMTTKRESIFNKLVRLISDAKNLIVFTDTQEELDFYELEEGDTVNIGDKADFGGRAANGSFMLADGITLCTFEAGVLTDIKTQSEEGDGNLAEKDVEIASLKSKIAELEAARNSRNVEFEALNKKINAFKSLESEFRAELGNEDKAEKPDTKSDINDRIKNYKF